jgi:hypothetical protein
MDTLLDGARRPAQATTPLDCQVSTYASATDRHGATATLRDCLTGQAFDTQAHELAAQIAATFDKDTRSQLKKRLPAFTPAGTFAPTRGATNLQAYTGLIPLDFDDCDVSHALAVLAAQPFIAYAAPSVSGRGAVALALVDTPAARHGQAFDALAAHFEALGLPPDHATRDVSRLRFFAPWDKLSFINDSPKPFTVPRPGPAVPEVPKPGPPNPKPGPFPPKPHGNAQHIPETALAELRRRVPIHDLAARLGIQRPHGRTRGNYHCFNHAGHNHGDRNPSLSIQERGDGGFFRCHGCGIKGDPIELYRQHTGANFADAVAALNELYGYPGLIQTGQPQANATPAPQPVKPAQFEARRYLSEISPALADFCKRHPRAILQAPTGTGKTRAIVQEIAPRLGGALIAVPLIALAEQIGAEYGLPVAAGTCDSADLEAVANAPLAVATFDRAPDVAGAFETLIVDEAHELIDAERYRSKAIRDLEAVAGLMDNVVLASATPPSLFALDEYAQAQVSVKDLPAVPLSHITYASGQRDATALDLAAETAADPNGLAIVRINDRQRCEVLAETLANRGFDRDAIAVFHRGAADGNEALESLIKDGRLPDKTRIVLTTSIIECGVSIYADGRNVRMIWVPSAYNPKSLVQFSARVRTCQQLEVCALELQDRETGTQADPAAEYDALRKHWQHVADELNGLSAATADAAADAWRHAQRPELNTSQTDALNALIVSDAGHYRINRPYLIALAERRAMSGIDGLRFLTWAQTLAPHLQSEPLECGQAAADGTATAAEIDQAAETAATQKQALNAWLVSELAPSLLAILQLAANATRSKGLLSKLKALWGIAKDRYDGQARALMQRAKEAGHASEAVKELAQWFAAELASLRNLGLSEAQALAVLAPNGSELAPQARLNRLKEQIRTAAHLELYETDGGLSKAETYDAKALERVRTALETGTEYSADEIARQVNAALGKRRARNEAQALKLAHLLFHIEGRQVRQADGGRTRVYRIVGARTLDSIGESWGIDTDGIRQIFGLVQVRTTLKIDARNGLNASANPEFCHTPTPI